MYERAIDTHRHTIEVVTINLAMQMYMFMIDLTYHDWMLLAATHLHGIKSSNSHVKTSYYSLHYY